MSEILHRSSELETGSGRTLHGLAIPYGVTRQVRDGDGDWYKERLTEGAFARSIRERGHKVRLLAQHNERAMPVGKATALTESPAGLHAELEVARTAAGDDLLELVRTGVVDSFSIGFVGLQGHWDSDDAYVRTECALREVSAVWNPAYPEARINGIRSGDSFPLIPRGRAVAWLTLTDW
ncbi:HK97 family phage prohead protease [Mycolicibacter minnesotensis]